MNQERPAAVDPAPPDNLTKHAPPKPGQVRPQTPRRSRRGWVWFAILVLAAAGAYYLWSRKTPAQAGMQAPGAAGASQKKGFGAIPVVAAKARKGDIPVYFTGLGAVTPIYTVDVQSRVTGELMQIYFKEGDLVHKGDPLVDIDPRPYQAALTQAEGNLVRDEALLANAKIDQARYKTLLAQNAVPEQQLVTQEALVKQDEGIVKYDQGVIDAAKVNLVYCHIQAPITGRIGLRLVDPGNIVQAPNSSPLLVITQIDPISVIFTLAEDQLPVVVQKLSAGQLLKVEAYDRTSNVKLAVGTLTTLDNQIDQTTGTLKLRATFDNKNNKLFPNQFVNVRLLVQLKQGVTLIPTATIQRNSQTTYVFLVQPNNKVTVRPITVGTVEGEDAEVTSGLKPGDVIVMTGVDKLQEGTQVAAHLTSGTPGAPGPPAFPAGNAPANTNPMPAATPPARPAKAR
jgi:membrane fusion protein, multidrug efflux system